MVHQYQLNGYNIVLDVNSGSVHIVDDVVYDVLPYLEKKESKEEILKALANSYAPAEIEEALELGVGYFVIDNVMECRRLIEIAMEKHIQTKALLRVNPGISAHTHEYIMTAKPDSKFGIFIDDTEHIGQVIELLAESSHVRLAGFHSHRFTDHGCAIF